MIQLVSAFCTGVFFGVALYINLVQQPAALDVGVSFAGRFFPPMYRRAARLQVSLAALGTLGGLWAWLGGGGALWLLGALLLFSVVPFTLVRIMPINSELLTASREPEASDTERLLHRWGLLHAVRTALSGLAFVTMLAALARG